MIFNYFKNILHKIELSFSNIIKFLNSNTIKEKKINKYYNIPNKDWEINGF